MRILFAVSNENVSDAIVKSYHKNYSDTITFKNVFYFNAIIKEIQRDRSYDRIIISEDLEPFANNNYDAIDKFIFERLESISEEINDFADSKIPIILICTDRRTKSSSMIHKLYNIGIYDALIGSDRRIDNVCKLINVPRTKEEAQQYYKLENTGDSKSSLEDVSEEEVQNIVSYYKKLGKNEERYTDSFNNIASQYTDAQLKIIIRYLPINVKAVLEAECPKYQELVTYASDRDKIREQKEKERLQEQKLKEKEEYEEKIKEQYEQKKKEQEKAEKEQKKAGYIPNAESKNQKKPEQPIGIDLIDRKMNRPSMQGEVLIPNAINTKNARRVLSDEEINRETTRTIRPEIVNSTYATTQPQPQIQEPQHNNVEGTENVQQPNVQQQSVPVVRPEVKQEVVQSQPEIREQVQNAQNVQPVQQEGPKDTVTLPGFEDLDTSVPSEKQETTNSSVVVAPKVDNTTVNAVSEPVNTNNEQTNNVEEIKQEAPQEPVKKGRGRPRKYPIDPNPKPKGKRGRPRKNPLPEEQTQNEEPKENIATETKEPAEVTLPGFENVEVDISSQEDSVTLPGFENENISEDFSSFDTFESPKGKTSQNEDVINVAETNKVQDVTDNDNVATLPGFEEDEFEDIDLPKASQGTSLDDDFMNFASGNTVNANTNNNVAQNVQNNSIADNTNINVNSNMTSNVNQNISNVQQVNTNASENNDGVALPGLDLDSYIEQDNETESKVEPIKRENVTLPGFEEDFNNVELNSQRTSIDLNNNNNSLGNIQNNYEQTNQVQDAKEPVLPGFEEDSTEELTSASVSSATAYRNNDTERTEGMRKLEEKRVFSTGSLESVLTRDKKIAAFIGTSKNGTSFIVNNLASLFSSIGVKTAILDMTKNRNAYYIYTNNDENLRQISYDAIDKLENGVAEGIKVDRNLDVYTAVPSEEKDFSNAEAILTTLARTYSLVLIDCDFDTPLGYFANAQEIYLVQSMDILTIQPLTAFLRELKTNGILDQEKLRVVVNKEIKVRGLTSKTIIGGMSFYNDPSMSYMTELFNKDKIKACTLPFEDSTYSKYLETLVNCNVSISGYSKSFMNSLKILGNMVYPLLSKQTYIKSGPDYTRSNFSDEMNNTLNQMRNKY